MRMNRTTKTLFLSLSIYKWDCLNLNIRKNSQEHHRYASLLGHIQCLQVRLKYHISQTYITTRHWAGVQHEARQSNQVTSRILWGRRRREAPLEFHVLTQSKQLISLMTNAHPEQSSTHWHTNTQAQGTVQLRAATAGACCWSVDWSCLPRYSLWEKVGEVTPQHALDTERNPNAATMQLVWHHQVANSSKRLVGCDVL